MNQSQIKSIEALLLLVITYLKRECRGFTTSGHHLFKKRISLQNRNSLKITNIKQHVDIQQCVNPTNAQSVD